MIETSRSPFALPAGILAIGLIVATLVAAAAYRSANLAESRRMTVTGSAERLVDADTAKWSVALSRSVPPTNQAEAGRQLDRDRAAFLDLLKEAGIPTEAVNIQPLGLSEIYETIDYKTGRTGLTGYAANQTLVIESPDVGKIGALAQNATVAMAEKGIRLSTQSLEYYYNKLGDVKLELLTAATRNARARGEAILAGGGGSLGAVTSADTGVFQVTAVNSADLSDYGSYDTTSARKKVTAVVHATFKLE